MSKLSKFEFKKIFKKYGKETFLISMKFKRFFRISCIFTIFKGKLKETKREGKKSERNRDFGGFRGKRKLLSLTPEVKNTTHEMNFIMLSQFGYQT